MTHPARFLCQTLGLGIARGTFQRWGVYLWTRCRPQCGLPSRRWLNPTVQPSDATSVSCGNVISNKNNEKYQK